jgi:histidyl-tRNA synthetase
MLVALRLLENLKIKNLIIHVNSIGCKVCRAVYRKHLLNYYKNKKKEICKDCNRRMLQNPLRLLDCKEEKCELVKKGAPNIIDDLCPACRKHFKGVLEYLDELKLPYQIDPFIVRGLDYYNRTVFEIFSEETSPSGEKVVGPALGGGGRYDSLFESLGIKNTSAVGAGLGMERIADVITRNNKINPSIRQKNKVFLIVMGTEAKKKGLELVEEFIDEGINISESMGKNSLGAQLGAADKAGAALALILGQKEVFKESIIIRDMKTGVQETVLLKKVVAEIKKRI